MSPLPILHPQDESVFDIRVSAEPLKSEYGVGLVITCFNRPTYLHRTLSALRKSDLSDTLVILVDDCSDDFHTKHLVEEFYLEQTAIIKAVRKTSGNCAIHENLKFGWDLLQTHFKCAYLTNLDSDAVVKPYWLNRLKDLVQESKMESSLFTGFNAYQHNTLREEDLYYEKESIGGINFFFSESIYRQAIRPCLIDLQWDHHVVNSMTQHGKRIYCTNPSVVQHIGRNGIWSGPASGIFDFAIDFGGSNTFLKAIRMLYFRGCRKMLFLLSPIFLATKSALRKMNILPAKLTDSVSKGFGSLTHTLSKWKFHTVYRKLYR